MLGGWNAEVAATVSVPWCFGDLAATISKQFEFRLVVLYSDQTDVTA